jgi:hypothetical protein
MGLSLGFYAGNSEEIIQAIDEVAYKPHEAFEFLETF